MTKFLSGKQVIVGVTGGIAAYKSADLVRRLRENGAIVRVVMTSHAKEFITPLTMQAVSGNPVHDELFDLTAEAAMGHIELARWADLIVVAPATANFMAKLVVGAANDLLTTLCIATKAPIAIAPSMNQGMWKNSVTQSNVQKLLERGIHLLGPAEGDQACGDVGPGRMLEPSEIIFSLTQILSTGALAGKKIVITAGPTREPLDPVRYISNGSSGKMGYALAEAALLRGAGVCLISGPVNLCAPDRAKTIYVTTADEMHQAVLNEIKECDVFISVAAVCDFRPKNFTSSKLPKTKTLILELDGTIDIVADIAARNPRPFVIGFAAETDTVLEKAKLKLKNKKLDMIIANEVGEGIGIDSENNSVVAVWDDQEQTFPLMSKEKLASLLIDLIAKIISKSSRS